MEWKRKGSGEIEEEFLVFGGGDKGYTMPRNEQLSRAIGLSFLSIRFGEHGGIWDGGEDIGGLVGTKWIIVLMEVLFRSF